ncbi:hypothetical protein GCM10010377_05950 [Streptomyces viridiviolaceus]|uniref:Uncharacterized protein n=1 Tax=Streptomyces viridiviolaceus TaxID=68282 RepID=A0ABW2E0R4_9ACTN|nr:hypothetical protein [Streptomyces viridiviolaceus]GHB18978.1 hypothetical protein GCM10010377_05950 [Streptomyces viridiviolaceus]
MLVGLAVVSMVLTAALAAEPKAPEGRKLDVAGQVTFALGLILVLYGAVEGPESGWTTLPVMLSFALGALSLAAFVVVELGAESPIFDLRLFRNRAFTVSSAAAVVGMRARRTPGGRTFAPAAASGEPGLGVHSGTPAGIRSRSRVGTASAGDRPTLVLGHPTGGSGSSERPTATRGEGRRNPPRRPVPPGATPGRTTWAREPMNRPCPASRRPRPRSAPRKSRTNAVIIGAAASVIVTVVTTGAVVVQATDDDNKPATTTTASSMPKDAAEPAVEEPEPGADVRGARRLGFTIELRTTRRQRFGSAGCNLTVEPELSYTGIDGIDPDAVYEITYEISGDEDGPVVETAELSVRRR